MATAAAPTTPGWARSPPRLAGDDAGAPARPRAPRADGSRASSRARRPSRRPRHPRDARGGARWIPTPAVPGPRPRDRLPRTRRHTNTRARGVPAALHSLFVVAAAVVAACLARGSTPPLSLRTSTPPLPHAPPPPPPPPQTHGRVGSRRGSLRQISATASGALRESYKSDRCSVTWFNHLQFTGGTSFQKNLLDLHRIVGVGANVAWDANGAEISVAAPNFVQVYDLGVDYASVSRRLDADVLAPIVSSIDAGHRGAYLVAHHINAPGVLMIEGFLDRLRGELERRDCDLAMASLARDPVAHRLSAKLKFDEALSNTFDPSLGALRERDPTFPVGDGNHPFAQMREFLFMDVLTSEEDDRRMREMIAADASRALVGADAETALDAFATIRAVAATAEARATQGMPHATVEGVLRHPVAGVAGEGVVEGGGEWAARFADARAAATSVANNFVAKWDVSLLSTEDQREALLRLADEMDWHPELLRGVGGDSDAFAGVQGSTVRSQLDATLNDALNTHGGAKTVDVASLPRDFSRALAGWTALDAALYLTAVAQKAASEAEASARFGTPDAIAARVGEARTPAAAAAAPRGTPRRRAGPGRRRDARRRRRARRSQGREGGEGAEAFVTAGRRSWRAGVPPGGARRRSGLPAPRQSGEEIPELPEGGGAEAGGGVPGVRARRSRRRTRRRFRRTRRRRTRRRFRRTRRRRTQRRFPAAACYPGPEAAAIPGGEPARAGRRAAAGGSRNAVHRLVVV